VHLFVSVGSSCCSFTSVFGLLVRRVGGSRLPEPTGKSGAMSGNQHSLRPLNRLNSQNQNQWKKEPLLGRTTPLLHTAITESPTMAMSCFGIECGLRLCKNFIGLGNWKNRTNSYGDVFAPGSTQKICAGRCIGVRTLYVVGLLETVRKVHGGYC